MGRPSPRLGEILAPWTLPGQTDSLLHGRTTNQWPFPPQGRNRTVSRQTPPASGTMSYVENPTTTYVRYQAVLHQQVMCFLKYQFHLFQNLQQDQTAKVVGPSTKTFAISLWKPLPPTPQPRLAVKRQLTASLRLLRLKKSIIY